MTSSIRSIKTRYKFYTAFSFKDPKAEASVYCIEGDVRFEILLGYIEGLRWRCTDRFLLESYLFTDVLGEISYESLFRSSTELLLSRRRSSA